MFAGAATPILDTRSQKPLWRIGAVRRVAGLHFPCGSMTLLTHSIAPGPRFSATRCSEEIDGGCSGAIMAPSSPTARHGPARSWNEAGRPLALPTYLCRPKARLALHDSDDTAGALRQPCASPWWRGHCARERLRAAPSPAPRRGPKGPWISHSRLILARSAPQRHQPVPPGSRPALPPPPAHCAPARTGPRRVPGGSADAGARLQQAAHRLAREPARRTAHRHRQALRPCGGRRGRGGEGDGDGAAEDDEVVVAVAPARLPTAIAPATL